MFVAPDGDGATSPRSPLILWCRGAITLPFPVCSLALLFLLSLSTLRADNLTYGFDSYPDKPQDPGDYTLDNGWFLSESAVWSEAETGLPAGPGLGSWYGTFVPYPSEGINSWIRSPNLSIGVGTVKFHLCNDSPVSSLIAIETSIGPSGPWIERDSITYGSDSWAQRTATLNQYGTNIYFRIFKKSGETYTLIDNIIVTNPPAKIAFSDVTTVPQPAYADKPTHIRCTITPMGLANSVTATSYWQVGASPWTGIRMTKSPFNNTWQTVDPIPGQSTGTKVYYYIRAWFLGNDPLSPTNEPAGGASAPYNYTAQVRPDDTEYEFMTLTGTFNGAMRTYTDYGWERIHTFTGSITNGSFQFRGVHTNGIDTNLWGILSQPDREVPFSATAISNAPAIQILGTNPSPLLFRFSEDTGETSLRRCRFQDFETWSTSGYEISTNQEWIAHNTWIQTDPDRQHLGRGAYLNSNGFAAVRSPRLPDGIGEISFWYRNFETAGVPATAFLVQKSETGGTNDSEWLTIESRTDIVTPNFARYTITINDRYHPYVRIRISTNAVHAALCIDELLISHAGSGVIISNVVNTPSSPTLVDPVTIASRIIPFAGASNLQAWTWWRIGTGGAFTAIGMTNNGAGLWTSTNRISASDGTAAGRMQYYISCTFTGFQSNLASPTWYPKFGASAPTSYIGRAAVTFSNAFRTIINPVITQSVPVSIEVYPAPQVTGPVVLLWYRSGVSGIYDSRVMTQTVGNTYGAIIPRGPTNIMQYYFECQYGGTESPYRVSSFHPTNAPAMALSYTNTDHVIFQDFTAWPGAPTASFANWTDGWWLLRNGAVANTNTPPPGLTPYGSPYSGWFNSWPAGTNAWIGIPPRPEPAGSIGLFMNNSGAGSSQLNVEYAATTNGPWTVVQSFQHTGASWTNQRRFISIPLSNVWLRIRKTGNSVSLYTGIDDITLTHRPASLIITNVVTHPGYPAENDPVHVSCEVLSGNPLYPPMGVTARLYYRLGGSGGYTGPIPMTRTGNRFTTDSTIPGRPSRSQVQFYIEVTFKGYHHFPWENHSPTFYPQGVSGASATQFYRAPTNTPTRYVVRDFDSIHDRLMTTTSVGVAEMTLYADNTWQGIVAIDQSTNRFTWNVLGYGRYTNQATAYQPGTDWFGDAAPTRNTLPQGGTGQTGAPPVEVTGTFTAGDQFLVRYNPSDHSYLVKRCRWQDFNTWTASASLFDSSIEAVFPYTITNQFNIWPLTLPQIRSEDFQSWTPFSQFTNDAYTAGTGWYIQQARIEQPDGTTNKATRLSDITDDGVAWPGLSILTDGLGTFSFRYRVTNAAPVRFHIQTASTNGANFLGPINQDDWQTVFTGLVANSTYLTNSYALRQPAPTFVRILHNTGTAFVVDDLAMTSWHGQHYSDANGWSMTNAWVVSNGTGTRGIEFRRSRIRNTTEIQAITSRTVTNGIESVEFDINVSNAPVTLAIESSSAPLLGYFGQVGTITYSTTGSRRSIFSVNTAVTSSTVRIRHISTTNTAHAIIDNVEVNDVVRPDGNRWNVYNTLITASQDIREFEPAALPASQFKTAYLNNSRNQDTGGKDFSTTLPYIESRKLDPGIGEIRFWYRNWETAGSPPARFEVRAAADRTTPSHLWTTVAIQTNITNTAYAEFAANVYQPTWKFVRIMGSTTTFSRVCIDNVLIAEPLASDFSIVGLTIDPPVPLYTNTLRFQVETAGFIANPSNIQMRVYYHPDKLPWATWPTSNYVVLDQVTTNGTQRIFSGTNGHGPFPIDTVVQYYARATFDGLFANVTSPKTYKAFSNPAWYAPINYNLSAGVTNPYYIVFSCPTGVVWINEINYEGTWEGSDNEFIEIAGYAGSIVSNWTVEPVNDVGGRYARYVITNWYLGNQTNGHGFWVIGDSTIPSNLRHAIFTNEFQNRGGVRLHRSSGPYVDRVSYGSPNPALVGFTYAGSKDNSFIADDNSVGLSGTGTSYATMFWTNSSGHGTSANQINWGQTLLPVEYHFPSFDLLIYVEITRLWLSGSQTWLTYTVTGNVETIQPVVWYATNLAPSSTWQLVTNPGGYAQSGNVYTQWFGSFTNQLKTFYRVRPDGW